MSRIGPRENLLTSGTAHPPTNRGRTWGYDALSQVFSAENDAQSRRVLRTTTAIAPPGSRHHPLPLRRLERHRRVFSSSLNTENFQLKTSLTWGVDLSGTLQGAVGVGGLLAVSDHRSPTTDHFFPTYDASRHSPYSPPLVPFVPAVHDYDTNLHAHKSLNLHRILPPAPTTQTATLYPCGDWINPSAPNSNCFANSQSKEYGFRYYEPLTGRWLNRDPIEEEGGINLYDFVGNDGVGRVDFLGLTGDVEEWVESLPGKVWDKAQGSAFRAIDKLKEALHVALVAKAMLESAEKFYVAMKDACEGVSHPQSMKLMTISTDESGTLDVDNVRVSIVYRRGLIPIERRLVAFATNEVEWKAEYSADVWISCCCPKGSQEMEAFIKGFRNQKILFEAKFKSHIQIANHRRLDFNAERMIMNPTIGLKDSFRSTPCDEN